MPVYEFRCDECGEKFDIVATLAEKEAGLHPTCPHCGGIKVRQVFGRFTVMGSSKSDADFDEGDFGDEGYGDELGDDFEDFGDEDLDLEDDTGGDIGDTELD